MTLKVLIVDDAAFIREILTQTIQKLGHIVIGEAVDGADAVRKSQILKPDVIFMDIVMPEQSGIDATKEILISQPQMKIIACTTLEQEMMFSQAIEAGCIDYVLKPFTIEDIKKVLKKSSGG